MTAEFIKKKDLSQQTEYLKHSLFSNWMYVEFLVLLLISYALLKVLLHLNFGIFPTLHNPNKDIFTTFDCCLLPEGN